MTEQEIIQAEKGFVWLRLSEFFQNVAGVVGAIGLSLIPSLLFVALFVFIAGGNVAGVFLWLGILEIISWTLFGLCMLLAKHYEKNFLEFAEEG